MPYDVSRQAGVYRIIKRLIALEKRKFNARPIFGLIHSLSLSFHFSLDIFIY